MHSVANLATVQTALATFFPFKKAPKPYLVSENCQYCPARSCFPFLTRTHLSPSLSVCLLSFCSAHAHTSLSLSLSLCICSVSVQRMHIHLSLYLSLSASAQFLFSACTHISLALSKSAQFLFSTSTHISLSLHVFSVYVQHAAEKSRA